ncbi:MAG: A/G-specific adenine glycosylase [Gammaproteobacteria bacterium]|nr:A/G-specific adenine glycosylase [Gammaproteobacteria bacterium]
MDPFAKKLIGWHHESGRKELPWQQQRSPYRVWLSEIMLQQTQVATVIPYFENFCEQFPDISTLAAAPLDSVLALGSGLGYYSRARNLHRAAERVVLEHESELPAEFDALMALPGIGRSTAGAIMAQAFKVPYPILDGNVRRVLCRYHGIEGWPGESGVQKRLWAVAAEHTPGRAGDAVVDYTQAIMDLGAMVCTPRNWSCESCPVAESCCAYRQESVTRLPTKKARKALAERETILLAMVDNDGALLLERRPPSGIWGGLWSLPEWNSSKGEETEAELQSWIKSQFGLKLLSCQRLETFVHTFTHFKLKIRPVLLKTDGVCDTRVMESSATLWYKADQFSQIGLPTPIKKVVGEIVTIQLTPE